MSIQYILKEEIRMSRVIWDKTGDRFYETGIDHGVLYPQVNGAYPKGVAWNGLTSVSEAPSGAEDTALYADNIKYLNLKSAEEFGLTIECYTSPDEWSSCDGSSEIAEGVTVHQQKRKNFGLCYRTKKGNDTDGDDYGYILHLVYGCSASPSEKSYSSVNDSPDAIAMSYTVTTTPVDVAGLRPTSLILVDSTKVDADKLKELEEILYGTDATDGDTSTGKDPRLPLPAEIVSMFAAG